MVFLFILCVFLFLSAQKMTILMLALLMMTLPVKTEKLKV